MYPRSIRESHWDCNLGLISFRLFLNYLSLTLSLVMFSNIFKVKLTFSAPYSLFTSYSVTITPFSLKSTASSCASSAPDLSVSNLANRLAVRIFCVISSGVKRYFWCARSGNLFKNFLVSFVCSNCDKLRFLFCG